MAIQLTDPEERAVLQRAVRYAYEHQSPSRDRRKTLIDIYKGESSLSQMIGPSDPNRKYGTLLNLFQQFVRGHLAALSYRLPRFSVKARTIAARGFDFRIEKFLQRYSQILDLQRVFRQCAMDTAFGNSIIKVITSIAPKGISSPVAPRAYRIDPNLFIMDPAAAVPEEASFMADIYLVPLNEARNHPGFTAARENLQQWRDTSSNNPPVLPDNISDLDTLAEAHTRLIDVYIPTLGVLCTWAAATDTFENIGSEEPLQVMPIPICPYEVIQLLTVPGNLEEISRLWSLRGLHLLANDMYNKVANQGRKAKRNPVDKIGNEHDMHNLSTADDGVEVFLEDPSALDLYQVPGPDASIHSLAMSATGLFSQYAGNLEVALGQSAGAETARQTQALIGQINASQAVDRNVFEVFMSNVAKKLATLAFFDEQLELDIAEQVPGTHYMTNVGWAPPFLLPRAGSIDDYSFETVAYSSAFRSPQERLAQLNGASESIARWMALQLQGAPINMEAIIQSHADAFDLITDLPEWWNGQPPTPQQQTANTYASTAGASQGSTVRYEGGISGGGGGEAAFVESSPGGLQRGGSV